MMTADTYVTHLLAIREAQSLRDLQRVRQELPVTRSADDAQTRFVRDQLAERELEIAAALTT
jgi:outer membrane protein assembly factor BamD (BamD/ComL family)